MRWLLFVAGVAAVAGVGAGDVPKDVQIVPPPVYQRWWHKMELCTARRGNMSEWQFRVNPNRYLRRVDSSIVVLGETTYKNRTITLSATSLLDSADVQHEMIHALGIRTHYYDVFVERCHVENDSTFKLQSDPVGGPK